MRENCGEGHPTKDFICVAPKGHYGSHVWVSRFEAFLRAATGPTLFSELRKSKR